MPLRILDSSTANLTNSDRSITVANTALTPSIVLLSASQSVNAQVNIMLSAGNNTSTANISSRGGSIQQINNSYGSTFTMSGSSCTDVTFESDGTNWNIANCIVKHKANSIGDGVSPIQITNRSSGGSIGTSLATVDVSNYFIVNQSSSGQVLTLPAPTNLSSSRAVTVENNGSALFTMYGQSVSVGSAYQFGWNGNAWKALSLSTTSSAQVRILANPGGSAYTQAQLQTAYDNQPGLAAPDTVPQAVSDYASTLGAVGYKVYLGANQWWYTNTATGIMSNNWTNFSGNIKGPFGAAIAASGLISYK